MSKVFKVCMAEKLYFNIRANSEEDVYHFMITNTLSDVQSMGYRMMPPQYHEEILREIPENLPFKTECQIDITDYYK